MPVHARSDVAAVTISQAHGGCGQPHSRPVVEGAPVKLWTLTCPQCEDVLRSDPLWSGTVSEIPETPDEQRVREDQQRRGQREQADATAHALERLAQLGDLPTVLARFIDHVSSPAALEPSMAVMCRNGHRNPQRAQFCSGCGVSMAEGVNTSRAAGAIEGPEDADGDSGSVPVPEDLESLKLPELRELAKRLGVGTARSRDEQIALIKAHVDD